MLRRVIMILVCGCLMGGCSALPAEERAFAVALGITRQAGAWQVSARIPGYQEEGEYLTLTAQGASLQEALAGLDAVAPMRMHYGQVRLLIFDRGLAETAEFPAALTLLAHRADMRLQAEVCVTQMDMPALMDALEPQTGTRLSKSLDVLLETRRKLGVIPQASLSAAMRMGERQCPVMLNIAAGEDGKPTLSGGWLTDQAGQVQAMLSPEETQLLMLMQGALKKTTLALAGHTVTLTDAKRRLSLNGNEARCAVTLRYTSTNLSQEGVEAEVQRAMLALTQRLASANCDALGMGGYAIRHFRDQPAWSALDWAALYPQLTWHITVSAEPPA